MTPWTRAVWLALSCAFGTALGAGTAGAAVVNMSVTFSPNASDTISEVFGGQTFQTNTSLGAFTPTSVSSGDTVNVDYSFGGKTMVFGGNGGLPEGIQLRFQGLFLGASLIDNVVGTFAGVTGQLLVNPVVSDLTSCPNSCFLAIVMGNLTNTGFSFTGGTVSFRIRAMSGSSRPIASVEAFALSTDLQIRETPLPAALPLFGTGLGLMGFVGWWRKRRAEAAA
jgi:hypothetical protein